jgi:hypothetical protein
VDALATMQAVLASMKERYRDILFWYLFYIEKVAVDKRIFLFYYKNG